MLAGRIQHYLRSVVAREREPIPAGPFVLYLHPSDPHPFLNYAIPAPEATEGTGAELIRMARAHARVPRLEYLERCFPRAEESLSASGFARESRMSLMTCVPDSLTAQAADIELRRVEAGSSLVRPVLTVTHAAFDEGPPDDAAVASWNGRTIAALAGGEVVGSASWMRVIDGMSEITTTMLHLRHER